MKKCHYCFSENKDIYSYCTNCGKNLSFESIAIKKETNFQILLKKYFYIIIILFLVIFLFIFKEKLHLIITSNIYSLSKGKNIEYENSYSKGEEINQVINNDFYLNNEIVGEIEKVEGVEKLSDSQRAKGFLEKHYSDITINPELSYMNFSNEFLGAKIKSGSKSFLNQNNFKKLWNGVSNIWIENFYVTSEENLIFQYEVHVLSHSGKKTIYYTKMYLMKYEDSFKILDYTSDS